MGLIRRRVLIREEGEGGGEESLTRFCVKELSFFFANSSYRNNLTHM